MVILIHTLIITALGSSERAKRKQVIQLLSALCVYNKEKGYRRVLETLDHFKVSSVFVNWTKWTSMNEWDIFRLWFFVYNAAEEVLGMVIIQVLCISDESRRPLSPRVHCRGTSRLFNSGGWTFHLDQIITQLSAKKMLLSWAYIT